MKKTQKNEEVLYGDIRDKIKSFEDASETKGQDSNALPVVDNLLEKDRKSIIAFIKLTSIIRALNEGWEPDWKDWNQRKWFNYFYYDSASGFVYSLTHYTLTYSFIGSRLCFKDPKVAEYAREQFKQLYIDYLLIDGPDSSEVK